MATKDSYNFSTFSGWTYQESIESDEKLAQTFTPSSSYFLGSVQLPLAEDEGGSGWSIDTVTVSIEGTVEESAGAFVPEGTLIPDGSSLGSKTIDGSGLPTDDDLPTSQDLIDGVTMSNQEFVFSSPIFVTSGTTYAIVVTFAVTEGSGGSAGLMWNWNSPTDSDRQTPQADYAGGNGFTYKTAFEEWDFISSNGDNYFELFSEVLKVPTSDIKYTKRLVAFGNNEVWYESSPGTMEELSDANGDIDVTEQLQAFELAGKVFIANGTKLRVADFQNVKFTTADIGDNPPDFGNLITGGTSGAVISVDYITTLSGACTIYGKNVSSDTVESGETMTGLDDDGNAISFVTGSAEVAGPHWYTWTVYGGDTDTYGTLPAQATLGCNYRGRAVLSGNTIYPHQWYMSRQLNPWDWAYIANDAQTPVAGNNTDAGEVGDIITTLIPYKDDFLVFGCASEVHTLTGDPAEGGSLYEIDLTVGMWGPKCYVFDKNGNLYFMGTDGVNMLKRGEMTLRNLTQQSIPNLLKDEDADQATHRVTMGFDPIRNGVVISITKLEDGTNSNYWFDVVSGGFFPELYPTVCGVYSHIFYKATDQAYKDLLMGCKDGYIRYFSDTAKNDTTTASTAAISSNVLMPIQDMNEEDGDGEGRLISTTVVTAGGRANGEFQDTDGVTLDIHVADEAETLIEDVMDGATPLHTKTFSGPGRQKRIRDRARGKWLGLLLKNTTASETWVLGKLIIKTVAVGRIK